MYKMQIVRNYNSWYITKKIAKKTFSVISTLFILWNISFSQSLNLWLSITESLQDNYNTYWFGNILDETQWASTVNNLFDNSMKLVESKEILPIIDASKKVAQEISNLYNINLKSSDIYNILYFSNKDFSNTIQNIGDANLATQTPTWEDLYKSCLILNLWRYKNLNKTSSYLNSNKIIKECKDFINNKYVDFFLNNRNMYSLNQANYWKELFWNNDLSDSSYDIMKDINNVARIIFENPKQSNQTLFYRIPSYDLWDNKNSDTNSLNDSDWNPDWNPDDKDRDRFNPDPIISNPIEWWWNNDDLEDIDWLEDECWGNKDNSSNQWIIIWWDENMNNVLSDSWNLCIDTDEDSLIDAEWGNKEDTNVFEDSLEWLDKDDIVILEDFKKDISDKLNKLSCNNNWICDGFESSSCSDCKKQSSENLEAMNSAIDLMESNWKLESLEYVKSCIKKCGDADASWTDKVACIAQCTCVLFESWVRDSAKHPWYWPVFKIRFCTVPPSETPFHKQATVNSIEEILINMKNIRFSLRDSWQLTPKNKTREGFDQSNQTNSDIWKQSAYLLNMWKKTTFTNKSEKQILEETIELHSMLLSDVLNMNKDDKNAKEYNKYVILWNPAVDAVEQKGTLDTSQRDTLINQKNYLKNVNSNFSVSYKDYLSNDLTVLKNNYMIDFLDANASFWSDTFNTFTNILQTSQALENKK